MHTILADSIVPEIENMAQLIYKDKHAQVFYHEGTSPYTLVTFNESGMRADGKLYWARALIEKNKINAYGVVSTQPRWFPTRLMKNHINAILFHRAKDPRPLMTYGYSMGGHAAIKFSAALGAAYTLAISPQYSIDPKAIADHRYSNNFDPSTHDENMLTKQDFSGSIHIVYDKFHELDNLNADKINELYPIRRHYIHHVGHNSAAAFASSKIFKDLVHSMMTESGRGIQEILRNSKKTTSEYKAGLIRALLRRRSVVLADRMFSGISAEDVNSHVLCRSLAMLHYRAGRAEPALAMASRAVELNRRKNEVFFDKISALLRKQKM